MNHYTYEELSVGMEESFETDITEDKMEYFYRITGDENPLHRDADFANRMGYHTRVTYGMLTASLLSTLAGTYLPGENSLIHTVEAEFPHPVYAGDHLTVTGKVQKKNDTFRTITLKVVIRNQNNEKVCRGEMRVGFLSATEEK